MLLSSTRREPLELLDLVGREMVRFRSWGSQGQDLRESAPFGKEFQDDHDLMKGRQRGSHPPAHRLRSPSQLRATDSTNRLGLPTVWRRRREPSVHPHPPVRRCGPVAVLSFLPARFLPARQVGHLGRREQGPASSGGRTVRPGSRVPRSPSRSKPAPGTVHGCRGGAIVTTRLDISVGPVQGFVSQSRRTRDLWGSSYLLSFLSAHAMRGARGESRGTARPAGCR